MVKRSRNNTLTPIFFDFLINLWYNLIVNGGINMVEKIITDRDLIYQLTRKRDSKLVVQYNIRNKRAWFQTESMLKRKPIEIKRVINL